MGNFPWPPEPYFSKESSLHIPGAVPQFFVNDFKKFKNLNCLQYFAILLDNNILVVIKCSKTDNF